MTLSAIDLKNLQTSNCKPLSPEDQSHRSPWSWADEARNLAHSLARLRFQQGSQPTWCLPPRRSRMRLTLRWSFQPFPHASAAAYIAAPPASQKGSETKAILPQNGCSAGKCINTRHNPVPVS